MANQVQIRLEDIDVGLMNSYAILGDEEPDLSFLEHKCESCNSDGHFYCNPHSTYVGQKCRNKQHNKCMNDGYVENIREFKQEVEFDIHYLHKEIKRFWIMCQSLGISMFDQMIYDLAESYDTWLVNLKSIADKQEGSIFDKILSRTDLTKMKSIHAEIQKAIDWATFDKTQLLYCLKLLIEKLGADFEGQIKQQKKERKEEGKANPLMESFKQGKLPKGAGAVDSMPKLCEEVQSMINRVKDTSVSLPTTLVTRSAVKLESGEYYEGQWTKSGVRQGIGRGIYPDGSVYEGFWENGFKSGMGRYATAKDYFEGVFMDDVLMPLGFYRYLKEEGPVETEQSEIDVENQVYFNPDSHIWQKFGPDGFIFRQEDLGTEIITSESADNSKQCIFINDQEEIFRVKRDNEGKQISSTKIYPQKKVFGLF